MNEIMFNEEKENKKKIAIAIAVLIFCSVLSIIIIYIAESKISYALIRIILYVIGLAILFCGAIVASEIDRKAGYFECPACNSKFVPNLKAYILGIHIMSKRRLVCPNCGVKKYCKKVLRK